jgi:hypothetical protein
VDDYVAAQAVIGLALAACEKTMQSACERRLRPAEKQHQPWLERIHAQPIAAYTLLDACYSEVDEWLAEGRPLQADITAAIAWQFTRAAVPDIVTLQRMPALAALSLRAAALPASLANPDGATLAWAAPQPPAASRP